MGGGNFVSEAQRRHPACQVLECQRDALRGLLTLTPANALGYFQRYGIDRKVATKFIDKNEPTIAVRVSFGAICPSGEIDIGLSVVTVAEL